MAFIKRLLSSDLDQCFSEKKDVGIYRWDDHIASVYHTTFDFHQPILKHFYKIFSENKFAVEYIPEPDNPHDASALRISRDGKTLSYVLHGQAVGLMEDLNAAGAPSKRMIGSCVIRLGRNGVFFPFFEVHMFHQRKGKNKA